MYDMLAFDFRQHMLLEKYNKIIPCGIKDKEITNLKLIKDQNYKNLKEEIVFNLIKNLKKKVF